LVATVPSAQGEALDRIAATAKKKKVATGLKKHFIYSYIILILEGSRTVKQKGEP